MKIEFSQKYSELDKCWQFGIVDINGEGYEIYIRWMWFHMGSMLGNQNIRIYPYRIGKVIYIYKFCNGANTQAAYISRRIKKLVNQHK